MAPGCVWYLKPLVSPAPAFVAAVALSPADWGDEDGDDEIYFFFTETSRAFDSYERIKVPRVARVCAVRPPSRLSVCHLLLCLSSCLFLSGPLFLHLSSVSFFPSALTPFLGVGGCGERALAFHPHNYHCDTLSPGGGLVER